MPTLTKKRKLPSVEKSTYSYAEMKAIICNLLEERENLLRQEYEKILNEKIRGKIIFFLQLL